MGEYNPKSKGLPATWSGIQRRLPKTLSIFQIVVVAGFLSLLILRSTVGIGSRYNLAGHDASALSEYEEEDTRLSNTDNDLIDVEPKRNLVQTTEQQLDNIQQVVARNAKGKLAEVERDEARKVIPLPNGLEEFPQLEGIVDFMQVEAQLAEEETGRRVAAFESVQNGDQEKVEEQEKVKEKAKVLDEKVSNEKNRQQTPVEPKAVQEGNIQEQEMVGESLEKREQNEEVSKIDEKVEPEWPREELSKEQAIERMNNAIRRDDPNAFTLGPRISDWDEQRADWMERNPDMKSTDPHKPKVLLLTGSQPWPCRSPIGDHYLLKMIKNKVDYARIHKIEIFYNLAHLDQPMSNFWAKLPLIRKMMLIHPEMEWIFWMDSDAMFTDMVFEIPFEKYERYNVVMWGHDEGTYEQRSWVACNTGVFFLRNNQWTLDLLETWSHMGPEGSIRNEAGHIMSSYLTSRPEMMADDQSALVFLMLTQPKLRPKILLESDFWLSGYWADIVGKYEEYSSKSRPGAGGRDWPFTTHFTGCQPCTGVSNQMYEGNSCLDGMERAFNFADNQVLKSFGFEHESLQGAVVKRIRNESTQPLGTVPVHNPWAVESFY